MEIDAVTQSWIRNRSDELAVENGCQFDAARAAHVCEFFPRFLRLYEGDRARQKFELMDWERELLSRIFGWTVFSEFHQRWIRRFRKASIWLPKKNGKSPLAAGIGLYLLCADGEMGQKVFSAARDGKQAAIVHTHARRMVEMSPDLSRVCRINNTTGRIIHIPTGSYYDILSGDNILGQEGLNGSAIIDETHVVDERLAGVLEHMGASRSEPLQCEVSTAGDNPQSYGKKQYDYGKMVAAGQRHDQEFFFAAWEAPQDATDEQLQDPGVWQQANPSLGVTINATEFANALARAHRSLADWIRFKKYRFNIWSTSDNPWFRIDDWARCERAFGEQDLSGHECTAGLDLSRTRDMTALALLFSTPSEDGDSLFGSYALLPYFFLPESRVAELDVVIPIREWVAAGKIIVTPGDVCDYAFVEEKIGELSKQFQIRELAFDPYRAEELTQRIENRFQIPRFAFAQTVVNFAGPSEEWERLVIGHKLFHDGNPVFTWQMGHVKCRCDANKNKRPVKPQPGDPRTIDGVVAGIMALGRQMAGDAASPVSVYDREDRGFVTIG